MSKGPGGIVGESGGGLEVGSSTEVAAIAAQHRDF